MAQVRNNLQQPGKVAPNGGYGWVIVFGASLTNVFNQSLVSLYGLLFGDKISELGTGTTGVALVMNMASLSLNFTGIFVGPLLKKCTPRVLTVAGSACVGTGLILCSFGTQLWHFVLTYSVMVGCGLGIIVPSAFFAINQYFTTRKGQAVGLSTAGTGVGQVVMPYVVSVLLDQFGFGVAVRIMGTLAFAGVIGGSLFKPLVQGDGGRTSPIVDTRKRRGCSKFCRNIAEKMDLKLLKDPSFLSLSVGLSLAYAASINFAMIYPFYLQNVVNMTQTETALSMSFLAGADLTSRLVVPVFTDHIQASSKVTFLVGVILLIGVRTVLATVQEKLTVILVSGLFGFVRATTIVNQNLAISEYCHKHPELLPSALGINMTFKGIFVITVGQFLGWLRDYFDSYAAALYAQNVVLSIVAVLWLPQIIYDKLLERRRDGYQSLCCEHTSNC